MSNRISTLLRQLADEVDTLLTPPAPTPPAPPSAPNLKTVTTNGFTLRDSSRPPVITDTLDLNKMLPDVPWTTFRDNKQHVAFHMQGREPVEYRRLPIYGYPAEYAMLTPALVNDKIEMLYPSSVNDANPALLIIPELKKFPLRSGVRGKAVTTPYWLVRGHTRYENGVLIDNPRIPAWVAVDMIGHIFYLMRDGSIDMVGKVELKTYANDFSYFDLSRKDMFVTDTAAGEVIKVHREGQTFTQELWCKVSGRSTSCRVVGRKLYVANETSVIEFDAFDKTVPARVVCNIPRVFWIDYKSDGKLVVMTRNSFIHIVDPETGTVGPDINGKDAVTGADYHNYEPWSVGWVMVDVDRTGSFGPVDAIYACASHNLAINGPWRIEPSGRISRIPGIGGGGRGLAGRSNFCIEGGHYQWVVAIHPDEGMIMIQGGSQILPLIYAAVSSTDKTWPVEESYNSQVLGRGYTVLRQGGSNPGKTFATSMGLAGNSMLGCSPDNIAQLDFDSALNFVRSGMLSVEPRTIENRDVLPVMSWIYRGSQRYVKEGKTLMDELRAWSVKFN